MMSMLMKGARTTTQVARKGARQMSSATEEEAKSQMERWTMISKGMMGLVGAFTVFQIFAHGHEHHEPAPEYTYLKLRNKPFPWEVSDCDLLDFECKRKVREAKEAME